MSLSTAVYWGNNLIFSDTTNFQQDGCKIHVGNSLRSLCVKVIHDMKTADYVSQEGAGPTDNPTFPQYTHYL